ncbi:hypothetical protein CR513_00412, partial [Mucuna pruriens]
MTFWNKTFYPYLDRFVVVLTDDILGQVIVYQDFKYDFWPNSDASKMSLSEVLMFKDPTVT